MPHKDVFKEEMVLKKLASPVHHCAKSFGFDLAGDGKGIKIAIIDTGLPDHLALPNISDSVNLADGVSVSDMLGQATILAGLIGASEEKSITGISPEVELYFSKVCDDNGKVSIESFMASILWSIIKGVDIIALSMTTEINNEIFHSTIKKAVQSGICLVAPAGVPGIATYPAAYPEVLSVGCLTQKGDLASFSVKGQINIIGTSLCSTYVSQTYCVSSGAANSVAIAAGLCALILSKEKVEPQKVYDKLVQLQGNIDEQSNITEG